MKNFFNEIYRCEYLLPFRFFMLNKHLELDILPKNEVGRGVAMVIKFNFKAGF